MVAVVLPAIVLIGLYLWWLWLGKDPAPGSIVPRWTPPEGLEPGPGGTLIDQRADLEDILATILDLARRGYIVIREAHPAGIPAEGAALIRDILERVDLWEAEWSFLLTDKPTDDLPAFEGAVLAAIFGTERESSMTRLRQRLPDRLPGIRAAHYDTLVRRGYFLRSPDVTRKTWVGLAIATGVLAFIAILAGDGPLGGGLALSAGIVGLFSEWMPARTRAGARARDELLGLKEYIVRAEKEEIEARHEGVPTAVDFETILPYAIALGVSDVWIDEFAGSISQPPAWYQMVDYVETTPFAAHLGVFCLAGTTLLASPSL